MKKIYILLTFILFLLSWNNSSAQAISNNNLKLNKTIKLFPNPSTDFIKVSESGISDPRIITGLKEYGFQGFLIGENFMKSEDPGYACQEFISQIR